MQQSPKGRTIEYVEGSPSGIISRGEDITELGQKMLDAAETLEDVKNNSLEYGGQKGKAIDKLKEVIGDSYEKLKEAGELYQPVGPVITTYGEALEDVQPKIKSAVDDSEDLWATYESLPGVASGDGSVGPINFLPPPEEGSPEAKQAEEDNAAKQAAYDAWEARAEDFDAHYNTWEDAFDTAVDGVGDKMSGQIKDSFWDNIGPVVDFLKNVLDIAALIVGIAALFFGGWVLALAAILAVAVLALTAAQWARGKASLGDLAWAAVGVVPFGKLSNLTKLKAFSKLGESGLGKTFAKTVFTKFDDMKGINKAATRLPGSTSYKLGFRSTANVLDDYATGLNRTLSFAEQAKIGRIAQVEAGLRNTGTVLTHYGRFQGASAHPWNPAPDLPRVPRPIGFVL